MAYKHKMVWLVIGDPSLFMDSKFRYSKRYFRSGWRAWKWARQYVRQNPSGEASVYYRLRKGIRDGSKRKV